MGNQGAQAAPPLHAAPHPQKDYDDGESAGLTTTLIGCPRAATQQAGTRASHNTSRDTVCDPSPSSNCQLATSQQSPTDLETAMDISHSCSPGLRRVMGLNSKTTGQAPKSGPTTDEPLTHRGHIPTTNVTGDHPGGITPYSSGPTQPRPIGQAILSAGLRPRGASLQDGPGAGTDLPRDTTVQYTPERQRHTDEHDRPTSPPLDRDDDTMEATYGTARMPPGPPAHHQPDYRRWPFPAQAMPTDTAKLYDAAKDAALRGGPAPRLDDTTNLNISAWEREVTGHPADTTIIKGIKQGFAIQYTGPPRLTPPAMYNHQSAVNFPTHIDAYIDGEIADAALSGLYTTPPFTPWFTSSPMMSREKSGKEGRRIIVDLSFPDGGINYHIPPHIFDGRDAVHNLPTIASAVATIAATPPGDIHLAVIDLSRAYRQFPVSPLDWPLLGISWRSKWAFDRRLPFGCRMSSFIMQSVAEFIVRALASRQVRTHMYLDDIIVVSPTKQVADRDFQCVLALLQELGLAVATHKLQPPSPSVTWLGIDIDVDRNQLSIPPTKLGQIKDCMAAAASRKYLQKKLLQHLIGLANHLSKVVRAARTFICRLLAALRAATSDYIRVTTDIKADLQWYSRYLAAANGRAIIPVERIVMRIWADACLKGAGASDGKRYYEYTFTPDFSAAPWVTY